MRTPRLYTPQPLPLGQTIELEVAAGHYIGKVLRMQEKQEVILFNQGGTQVSAHISNISKKIVRVLISAQLEAPQGVCTAHPLGAGYVSWGTHGLCDPKSH